MVVGKIEDTRATHELPPTIWPIDVSRGVSLSSKSVSFIGIFISRSPSKVP